MQLLGIRKCLSKPLFQFPRRKNLIPKPCLFPAITVSGIAGYCNNNSRLLVSVDGFLLHNKSRGMQWKGQFWARQNTAYVILGKLFKSLSKKGSRQHLQCIASGFSLLLECRWRAARLRKQSSKLGSCLNLAGRGIRVIAENSKCTKCLWGLVSCLLLRQKVVGRCRSTELDVQGTEIPNPSQTLQTHISQIAVASALGGSWQCF